jgi:hypothetical protein
MASSKVSTSLLGAVAGAAMLLSSATPSFAFTLAATLLAQIVASPEIEHIWWNRWGRWHPNRHWHRWGWTAPPAYGFYPTPAPPAFGVYVLPPPPPVYEYYVPRQRWGDEDD